MVLLVTVSVPLLEMPPPLLEVLPAMVQLATTAVPAFAMPPPLELELPLLATVLLAVRPGWKSTGPPEVLLAMSSRSEPATASLRVVTVAGSHRCSRASAPMKTRALVPTPRGARGEGGRDDQRARRRSQEENMG